MQHSLSHMQTIFQAVSLLKKLKRTGWILRGIRNGESLAEHSFGTACLAWVLSREIKNPPLDSDKVLKMAIVHDISEAFIGDIPYVALKYFSEKSQMENAAFADITADIEPDLRDEMRNLFAEFQAEETPEAKFVKAVDKLDMLITAAEYEKAGTASLLDFWNNSSTFEALKPFEPLYNYANKLRNERADRLAGRKEAGL